MARVKLLGINDDVTTCECCGRAGLKKTVVLELDDCGSQVHFGTDCAARALRFGAGAKMSRTKLVAEAKLAESGSHYAYSGPVYID